MAVTSYWFLLFLAVVAALYRLCPAQRRSAILFVSSYLFYFAINASFGFLLLGATMAAFLAGHAIEASKNGRARSGFALGFTAVSVAVLALFKAAPLLPSLRDQLAMPMGLSYYTFKLIGYVIDIYWEKTHAEKHFIRFAAFVTFFPQIVAGPIQRGESLLPQLAKGRTPTGRDYLWGCQRLLLGYFKKFVVADNLALAVDFAYKHFDAAGTPLLMGYYLYPLQMYADFSGLTDIAVGAAALVGVVSPENFEAPFSAPSPSAYWRRWHITLTTWLTDYVFMPLHMSTRTWGDAGLVFSLFVNMVLVGLWHGFRWTFALFGLVHAIYLTIDALTARARKRYWKAHPAAARAAGWAAPVFTFHLVAVAFVFFRAESASQVFYVLSHLAQGFAHPSSVFAQFVHDFGRAVVAGLCGYAIAEVADWMRRRSQRADMIVALPRWGRWSVYSCTAASMALLSAVLLTNTGATEAFLYAVF